MIKIALAGTSGLAQYFAHYISTQTCHQFVFLSRKVSFLYRSVFYTQSFLMLNIPFISPTAQTSFNTTRLASFDNELRKWERRSLQAYGGWYGHFDNFRPRTIVIDRSRSSSACPSLRAVGIRRFTDGTPEHRPSRPRTEGCPCHATRKTKVRNGVYCLFMRSLLRKVLSRWSCRASARCGNTYRGWRPIHSGDASTDSQYTPISIRRRRIYMLDLRRGHCMLPCSSSWFSALAERNSGGCREAKNWRHCIDGRNSDWWVFSASQLAFSFSGWWVFVFADSPCHALDNFRIF